MSEYQVKYKDPDAKVDYKFDWTQWLESGDAIATSSFVASTGITLSSESKTDTSAVVWVAGGTVGKTYTVTNRITTTAGRINDLTMSLIIANE